MSKERQKVLKLPVMKDLPYHFGIKMRCYPSTKQMQMIRKGIDASRFTYNELVARNQDVYDVRTVIQGMIYPWFAFRFCERCWVERHDRNREASINDVLGMTLPFVGTASYLDRLVKYQILGGWRNPEERNKKRCKPKYGTFYENLIKSNITNQTKIRNSFEWLQDKMIANATVSMAMTSYKNAWNLWRKAHNRKVGTPRFKRKDWFGVGSMQLSNTYAQNESTDMYSGRVRVLDRHHINLPKLGRIRVTHLSHFLNGHNANIIRIGTVTVRQDNLGYYWVSFALGSTEPFKAAFKKTGSQLGIDLNTDNFLTDSNGDRIENPRYYRNAEKYLKHAKRVLSRRQLRAKKENRSLRDSKNYLKQRILVAKKMKRISNRRNSFLDELSLTLIKNHDLVVAENLNSKNMLKNHALAKSISDVGWRTFIQKLTYKAGLYGKKFITVDPKNTTQMCHDCGYVCGSDGRHKKLKLKDREWICPNCGAHHIRDYNAALNILEKGQQALA